MHILEIHRRVVEHIGKYAPGDTQQRVILANVLYNAPGVHRRVVIGKYDTLLEYTGELYLPMTRSGDTQESCRAHWQV